MKSFMNNFFCPKGTTQVLSTVTSSLALGMSKHTHTTPIPMSGRETAPVAPAQILHSVVLNQFCYHIKHLLLTFEGSTSGASALGIFPGFTADQITYYPDLTAPADTICKEYLIPLLDQMLQERVPQKSHSTCVAAQMGWMGSFAFLHTLSQSMASPMRFLNPKWIASKQLLILCKYQACCRLILLLTFYSVTVYLSQVPSSVILTFKCWMRTWKKTS